MIKTSKKLNKLATTFSKIYDYWFEADVIQFADKICSEDSNDYRSCDLAEYIIEQLEARLKVLKGKKKKK